MKNIIIFCLGIYLSYVEAATQGIIPAGAESFECGTYELSGRLTISNKGDFYLNLYPNTTRQYSIQIKKMPSFREVIVMDDRYVSIKVNVAKSGKGNLAIFNAELKPHTITLTEALNSPVRKISSLECK
jgi:hypothetical protein